MLKKHIKKLVPNIHELQHKYNLGFLGKHIFSPHLWHFHRKDVARSLALGIFIGLTPLPGHMLIVACIAIFVWSANLPIALTAVWISNPATLAPISYLEYKIGVWVLGWPEAHLHHFHIDWTWKWFAKEFIDIWEPMMLGALLLGVIVSFTIYALVLLAWRTIIVYRWKTRTSLPLRGRPPRKRG